MLRGCLAAVDMGRGRVWRAQGRAAAARAGFSQVAAVTEVYFEAGGRRKLDPLRLSEPERIRASVPGMRPPTNSPTPGSADARQRSVLRRHIRLMSSIVQ